ELAGVEALALGRLRGGHSGNGSLILLAAGEGLRGGAGMTTSRPGSLRGPPVATGGGFLGPSAGTGGSFLAFRAHLPCHNFCVRFRTPPVRVIWVFGPKK